MACWQIVRLNPSSSEGDAPWRASTEVRRSPRAITTKPLRATSKFMVRSNKSFQYRVQVGHADDAGQLDQTLHHVAGIPAGSGFRFPPDALSLPAIPLAGRLRAHCAGNDWMPRKCGSSGTASC